MNRILFYLVIVLFLAGCNSSPPTGLGAYPAPDAARTSPYPGPGGAVRVVTPTPLPKPNSDVGTITGRLMNASTGQPLQGMAVYLGDIVSLTPGPAYVITFQQNTSARGGLDADGYFAIPNVKPGTFGLIVWTPINSTVVPDPKNSNKELLVTVKPGEIADIGEVQVNWF